MPPIVGVMIVVAVVVVVVVYLRIRGHISF